ncbi:MAG: ATP-grasp domain-containing protein [Candidatus Thiodiazotropha sp.]
MADAAFSQMFLDRFLGLVSMTQNNGIKEDFIKRLSSPLGVSLKEILLEAILAVETSAAFSMHELYDIGFAAIQSNDHYIDYIWESTTPKLSQHAAEVALLGLIELLPKRINSYQPTNEYNFERALHQLNSNARRNRLSPSTSVIKLAAKRRGIPIESLGTQHLVLGEGKFQRHMYASMSDTTSSTSQKLCANKRQTNRRLKELRLPVAKQMKVGSIDEAQAAAKTIGFPIVIKPVKGKKGHAVTAGIETPDIIPDAFKKAHKQGSDVLIEKFIAGDDHRLLVVNGKFLAAAKRLPPTILGDGTSTVDILIDRLNADPYRDRFRGFPVDKDAEVSRLLHQAGLSLNDVLEKGRSLALRSAANVSTGGTPIDVTDLIHPDNRDMALRAAAGVGLNIAGIDFITRDISKSYRELGGAIVEINARPGIDIHIWPKVGTPRDITSDILRLFFPSGSNGRIPTVAVAGDKGIGVPARNLDKILRGSGKSVALVLRNHSYLNGSPSEMSRTQQRNAAKLLLRDPSVETLVSTVSLRRAATNGLLLEKCSLSILMDKFIEEKTELFHKGIEIIERATTHCFVIGANNHLAFNKLKRSQGKRVILVDDNLNNTKLQQHLAEGHSAVTTSWRNGKLSIILMSGEAILGSFPADSVVSRGSRSRKISFTRGMMFAIAAAHGLGLSGPEIVNALNSSQTIASDAKL